MPDVYAKQSGYGRRGKEVSDAGLVDAPQVQTHVHVVDVGLVRHRLAESHALHTKGGGERHERRREEQGKGVDRTVRGKRGQPSRVRYENAAAGF